MAQDAPTNAAMTTPKGIAAMERRKATCPKRKGITVLAIFIEAGGLMVMVLRWLLGRPA